MPKALTPGTTAPDFTVRSTIGETLSLNQLRGKPVVIAFYPADWSAACSSQMPLYQEGFPMINTAGAQLVAISVDNLPSHTAWAASMGLTYPLLSDFHPHGAVAKAFGVLRPDGRAERAIFVIDAQGIIRFTHVSPQLGIVPGLDVVLQGIGAAK